MKRRTLLATGAAALALPHIARSQTAKVLKFIPQVDPPLLDPVITSAYIARNFGFTVYDTLFGQDGAFKAQPQMVDRLHHRATTASSGRCPCATGSSSTTAPRCWRATAPRRSRAGASATRSARR